MEMHLKLSTKSFEKLRILNSLRAISLRLGLGEEKNGSILAFQSQESVGNLEVFKLNVQCTISTIA